jgi:hypothetical protein
LTDCRLRCGICFPHHDHPQGHTVNDTPFVHHSHPHQAGSLAAADPPAWSIENDWHWARGAQLGEAAHRFATLTDLRVFPFLCTVFMNLLRRGGYRSIRQGLRERAFDIKGMLALGGVTTPAETT